MTSLKTYVPDPESWARYFEKVLEGKAPPRTWRKGGEIITIEKVRLVSRKPSLVRIEAVTPVERTVAQAKSELRRQGVLVETDDQKTPSSKRKREKKEAPAALKSPKRNGKHGGVQATSIKAMRRNPNIDNAGF